MCSVKPWIPFARFYLRDRRLPQGEPARHGGQCVHGLDPNTTLACHYVWSAAARVTRRGPDGAPGIHRRADHRAASAFEYGRQRGEDGMFELQGIKVFIDGTLGSRGAALLEPYADADTRGFMDRTTKEVLMPVLAQALRDDQS